MTAKITGVDGEKMVFINLKKGQDGFTLTEIMIVVAIIGIVAAVAVPTFLTWLPGYRLKSAIRDLQGHFQMAKAEAVKRGNTVSFEITAGAYSAAGRIGGYTVFVDPDNDQVFDAGEILIARVTMPHNVSLTASTFPLNGVGTNTGVSFNSRGLPNIAGTVTMRNQDVSGIYQTNLTGRGRIQRSVSTDGGATFPAASQWD